MNHKIKKIILDTDPGQDDAAAILMSFGLQNLGLIELIGITCVAGNVPLSLTSKNARIICDWANKANFPVYAGFEKPILKKLITAENVHGNTGLGGVKLHTPKTPLKNQHAVEYIIDTLEKSPKESITICAIGPLTNIALALKLTKNKASIKEIVIMGGNFFEHGNITPCAEFNFFVDPIAAQMVLQSNIPIKIIPLDVTHKACITQNLINSLNSLKNNNGPRIVKILQSYERYDIKKFGLIGGPLHDPCAIACVVDDNIFKSKKVYAQIEINNNLTEGSVVLDWNNLTNNTPNVSWYYDLDSKKFFDLFFNSIKSLN